MGSSAGRQRHSHRPAGRRRRRIYFDAERAAFRRLQTGVGGSFELGRDTMTNVESLIGSNFTDSLSGNEGFNFLLGSGGNDALDGRAGFDVAFFPFEAVTASLVTRRAQGEGTDTLGNFEGLAGSARNDRLIGDGRQNFLQGGEGDDSISGGGGPDVIFGKEGSDRLDGGAGDDKLFGGLGNDVMSGGAGVADSVSYIDSPAGVRVSLATHTATGGEGSDQLGGVEGLAGSGFADDLTGDAKANEIFGNDGNDTISTGAGSDFAGGGGGTDTIQAGGGSDYCLDEQRGRGCEITGAPAIPGAPDAPPTTSTPGTCRRPPRVAAAPRLDGPGDATHELSHHRDAPGAPTTTELALPGGSAHDRRIRVQRRTRVHRLQTRRRHGDRSAAGRPARRRRRPPRGGVVAGDAVPPGRERPLHETTAEDRLGTRATRRAMSSCQASSSGKTSAAAGRSAHRSPRASRAAATSGKDRSTGFAAVGASSLRSSRT